MRRPLIATIGVIALLVLAVVVSIALTSSGDSTPMMTMPDGSTMPASQMTSEANQP